MTQNSTSWKPGQSGNPAGKKPVHVDLARQARLRTQEALDTLIDLMHNSADDKVRLVAAEKILDRGYGRTREHIALPSEAGGGDAEEIKALRELNKDDDFVTASKITAHKMREKLAEMQQRALAEKTDDSPDMPEPEILPA